jgi:predicted AAA+ superfamily ATPase
MIKRDIEATLVKYASQFKAVAITGPRQSGKTTLARMVFPDKDYVSLEDPDYRMMAVEDPRRFLERYKNGCILDEAQRAPQLFSYLQGMLDSSRQSGRFIITGSQQLGMMQQITQSLAGRVAPLSLLPFSKAEIDKGGYSAISIDTLIFNGGYPPVYDQNIDVVPWMNAYIDTYVERDVRQIINIRDTQRFTQFVRLCAGNIGQLFNASRLGTDCGANHGTVSNWLSILNTSYITFQLYPHHRNYRKRLVKTPKIYFYDTGLACRLLGIERADQLATHPLRGALFENWVISELLKTRYNSGRRNNLFFWRNNTGLEVDVIIDDGSQLIPIEIKSGATLTKDWFKSLEKWGELAKDDAGRAHLIYGGSESFEQECCSIHSWQSLASL